MKFTALLRFNTLFLLIFSLALLVQSCQTTHSLPQELAEVSGCARLGIDSLIWINDGGNEASLFFTDAKGTLLGEKKLPNLPNRDWEALAVDVQKQRLFIGDFGNNCNCRRDLCIFSLNLKGEAVDSIRFQYADQKEFPPKTNLGKNFDCEGFFFHQDSLFLFSKARFAGNFYSKLYVLPAKPGQYSVFPRDSMLLLKGVVTDAAIHPGSERVALMTYWGKRHPFFPQSKGKIFIFQHPNYAAGPVAVISLRKLGAIRQYETVVWLSGDTLLISNERRKWQKQRLKVVYLRNPAAKM